MKKHRRSVKPKTTGLKIDVRPKSKRSILLGLALVLIGVVAGMLLSSFLSKNTSEPADIAPTSQLKSTHSETGENTNSDTAVISGERPQYLSIDKLGVHKASVLALGVEDGGEMAAPGNNQDVGWYKDSSVPGDDGSLLMNGHVGLKTAPAVFAKLHDLVSGDVISVENYGGETYNYTVYHVEQLPMEKVDMRKMMRSVDPSRQGLNIITCAGEYDRDGNTFTDRVLVYAVRSS